MYENENGTVIKSIRLAYENGEVIDVPIEHVSHFHMNKFDKMFAVVNDDKSLWMDIANDVNIVLKSSLNKSGLGLTYDDMIPEEETNFPIVERLSKRPDLAALAIIDDQDNKSLYYVKWVGDRLSFNEAFSMKLRESGDLSITVN